MRIDTIVARVTRTFLLFGGFFLFTPALAQSNVNVRVMAANLNGNSQTYEDFALRIFQGLKPDVVAIQEFNYASTNGSDANNAAARREMVNRAFGTNFFFFCETNSGQNLPNGIISRYPIVTNSSWTDTLVGNRGFAWAQIDLPGSNDLYVVSVHFLTDTSAHRASEAANLKALMQAAFPANAWIVVAGDFNAGGRTEACVTSWNGYLTDFPIPVDKNGIPDTSMNRNSEHDFVLPSLTLTNFETATLFGPLNYPSGLVFDSRVYTANELTNFPPVQAADSGLAQHMAVIKDFLILAGPPTTNPPAITSQPQNQGVATGNNVTFAVGVTGTSPLSFQWRFNGTNIFGATTNPFTFANAQFTNAGNYSVTITNLAGSVTSSNAVLTVSNAPPLIATQPQNQTVLAGQNVSFSVTAGGTLPLTYQWRFGGSNIFGATTNPFVLANVQTTNAGNFSVVITNIAGSVTSSVATLTVLVTNPVAFAQWNFNSVTPDGSTATGSTAPSIGTGTASLVGGATATFATGDPAFDPAGSTDQSAWNTATYPTQGTGNKTRGAQFAVSTAGKQNIVISWSSESPSTGSKYGRLQYSTNGTDFVDFSAAFVNGTAFTVKTNSLASISGVNNNANFAFRFVSEFESTAAATANANYDPGDSTKTYGTAGSMRYDMVTVSGTSFIVATPAVLTLPAISGNQFGFTVTGSVGANYILQTSTNLAATNWIPIFTNTSPFPFGDPNLSAPQKFYRAVSQ